MSKRAAMTREVFETFIVYTGERFYEFKLPRSPIFIVLHY